MKCNQSRPGFELAMSTSHDDKHYTTGTSTLNSVIISVRLGTAYVIYDTISMVLRHFILGLAKHSTALGWWRLPVSVNTWWPGPGVQARRKRDRTPSPGARVVYTKPLNLRLQKQFLSLEEKIIKKRQSVFCQNFRDEKKKKMNMSTSKKSYIIVVILVK